MEEKLNLLKELYDLTVRQEKAINLGLIPRFMRLLEQREEVLKKIEDLKVEKDENIMYDEIESEINKLSHDIMELDKKNMDNLAKQKVEAKKNVEDIIKYKRIMFETYDKPFEQVVGNHFDNKQ